MKSELLHLASLAEYARTGPTKPPQRLASFIVAAGGLKDYQGEIANMCDGGRGRPCLINNRSGLHLDDATRYAWENGFIASEDRPEISEFLDLLACDLGFEPITSIEDDRLAHEFELAQVARDALDEYGLLADTKKKQAKVELALRKAAQ